MPYAKEVERNHGARVRDMFAEISGRYDLLNHILSMNIDRSWRRQVAENVGNSLEETAVVLDVACGTGDLSLALRGASKARVFATDFCRPMLDLAARKSRSAAANILFVEGDALNLPFADKAFDAVTIAFGLRNLASIDKGLRELWRVIRAGGAIAILEFSRPTVPGVNALYQLYFTRVLPRLGGIISRSQTAYEYLPASVSCFPDQKSLASLMRETGFTSVHYHNLTFGIAAVHYGRREP